MSLWKFFIHFQFIFFIFSRNFPCKYILLYFSTYFTISLISFSFLHDIKTHCQFVLSGLNNKLKKIVRSRIIKYNEIKELFLNSFHKLMIHIYICLNHLPQFAYWTSWEQALPADIPLVSTIF